MVETQAPQVVELTSLAFRQAAAPIPERLRVRDLLSFPGFVESVVASGESGLSRDVEQVNVMQVPTDRYAKADELILAAASVFEHLGDGRGLVVALADRGVAALAIRGAPVRDCLGSGALRAADERALPIIELPTHSHLNLLQAEVLERIVAWQRRQLTIAEVVRERLSSHVLSGGELESLPAAVAEIIEGQVAVFDAGGNAIATSDAEAARAAEAGVRAWLAERRSDPVALAEGWIIWPALAGTRVVGCLVARPDAPLSAVNLAALEHGATIAALKILQRREAVEASSRLVTGFVRDLISGSLDEASALRRAETVGWDPEQEYRTVVTTLPRAGFEALSETIRWLDPGALVTERSGACLAVVRDGAVGDGDAGGEPIDWFAAQVLRAHDDIYIGMSSRRRGLATLPLAVTEAEEAVRVARVFGKRSRVRAFDRIGILRLLLEIPMKHLHEFPSAVLAPLDALPDTFRAALLETMELLLESGGNLAETARRGGWHYNTVRSRAARLRDLLGPFLENGARLDAVALALLLRRELAPVDHA